MDTKQFNEQSSGLLDIIKSGKVKPMTKQEMIKLPDGKNFLLVIIGYDADDIIDADDIDVNEAWDFGLCKKHKLFLEEIGVTDQDYIQFTNLIEPEDNEDGTSTMRLDYIATDGVWKHSYRWKMYDISKF